MSESDATGRAAFGLTADLEVSVEGATADIRTVDGALVVDTRSLPDAYRLVRAIRRGPDGPVALVRRSGLPTEVRIRGETVAVVGPQASPGRLSRLLGVGGLELRPRRILAAGLGRGQ